MSTNPRKNQLSCQSENFCQDAQNKHVNTFVTCARKRGITAQSACNGYSYQASGVSANACLPSRLISWFEPRLPLSCRDRLCASTSGASWWQPNGEGGSKGAVFLCAKRRTATFCLVMCVTFCLGVFSLPPHVGGVVSFLVTACSDGIRRVYARI